SAQWAADALTATAADPSARYASMVQDAIGLDLARAARLKESFFKPQFTHLLIDALSRSAAIAAVMADLIAGRLEYRSLNCRLVTRLKFRMGARLSLGGFRRGRAAEPGSAAAP